MLPDIPELTDTLSHPARRRDDIPIETVHFILSLCRALHGCGYAAHRLEAVLALAAQQLGVEAQFFSTPTSIFVSFGKLERQRTHLIRVEPAEQDLGKLSALDRLTTQVLRGELTPKEGSDRIALIQAAPPRYGGLITTLAFGLASGAATRFLGGGGREIVAGTTLGVIIGLLALVARRFAAISRIFEPAASFTAAFLAAGAAVLLTPFSVFTATMAGLIVLVPGFTLTIALTELSTRHLLSGTARLSGAFMTFLGITFGVALGNTLAIRVFGVYARLPNEAIPPWTNLIALVVAPVAFTILLKAEERDIPWLVLMGILAFYGSRLGTNVFGPELGAFVGAFVVGTASNVFARLLDRPSQVLIVPGILLLVPGSIGYRSLNALMEREVVSGIETAFSMLVIAVSLVAGLLMSNAVTPRRSLP